MSVRDEPVLSGLRVLVVEDDYHVAASLRLLLESCGCEVIGPAGAPDSAKALIDASPPDAAVLDVRLGRERSTDVARTLVSQGCPFVFISGVGEDDLPDELRGRPVVPKPVVGDELLAALARATGRGG